MTLLFIHLDKERHKGYLYQQVYSEIKKAILNRKLEKDDKLPSKRDFATHLNVSINTITYAYEQLLAEGYIYAIERSGYYVENIVPYAQQDVAKTLLPEELKEQTFDRKNVLSLSHFANDTKLFPFADWKKCQQQAMENHSDELALIPHHQGPYLVRKTIAKIIQLTRGVVCEPEQIVISVGTQPLIQQLIQMQMPQSERVIKIGVEDPGYARLYRHLMQTGAQVEPLPLDQKGINMHEIRKVDPDIILVTPSHQFPMGMIMPISRRIQLLNWANEQPRRYIIEDDYDSEFKYKTDQIPSLQSLDHQQRVIYLGTFSKTLLTGLRISYMVLPIPLLKTYREHFYHLIPYNNTLNLLTLHYFIEGGAYTRHIKRMNNHYELKRQKLIALIEEHFRNRVHIEDIPAGLHFVAHFKTNKSYDEIEKAALQNELEIYTLRRFMLKHNITKNGEVTLIIGFAGIEEYNIAEAVKRLGDIV